MVKLLLFPNLICLSSRSDEMKDIVFFLVKPSTWTWFQMLDLVFRVEIAVCLSPNPVVVSITCYNN